MSVLKLTQVGEERILRRSREPSLRNSAKWFRNFGRRIAVRVKAAFMSSPGSRRDPAQATVYQKHRSVPTLKEDVYGLTPAQCRKVKGKG